MKPNIIKLFKIIGIAIATLCIIIIALLALFGVKKQSAIDTVSVAKANENAEDSNYLPTCAPADEVVCESNTDTTLNSTTSTDSNESDSNAPDSNESTTDLLSQEELDYIHYVERSAAALPYEDIILPEFRADYERNNRVVGHIRIEDTDVDCPILSKLEDYEYYLTHDIDNNESKQGCIILDPDSEMGIGTKSSGYLEGYEPTTNLLIHGHNMRAGTMFGNLEKYAKEDYGLLHKYIYVDTLYEKRTYELITAFYSKIYPEDSDEFKYYNFNQANTEEEWNYWYNSVMDIALYRTELPLSYGDEIITLSTCAYYTDNGRFAVVAKRIE